VRVEGQGGGQEQSRNLVAFLVAFGGRKARIAPFLFLRPSGRNAYNPLTRKGSGRGAVR
jgi:hypothetical protein